MILYINDCCEHLYDLYPFGSSIIYKILFEKSLKSQNSEHSLRKNVTFAKKSLVVHIGHILQNSLYVL